MIFPATINDPFRPGPAFDSTAYVTDPLPTPTPIDVIVIQLSLETACQAHRSSATTLAMPLPPVAEKDRNDGLTE